LPSSSSDTLVVHPIRLVTIGDQTLPVSGSKLWNELPGDITAAQSVTVFRRQLKTITFRHSYPDFALFLFAARLFGYRG
jgi:hypothetical protein